MSTIKRIGIAALMIVGIAAFAAAQMGGDSGPRGPYRNVPAQERLEMMLRQASDKPIGEMTPADLMRISGALSVYRQQRAYVAETALKSVWVPGTGQFRNGETGKGALFLAAHILVDVGTMVGAYVLLPETVQFSSLNYLRESGANIEASWKSLSFMDLLPSMSVAVGGSIVSGAIRMFAAKDAADVAMEQLVAGEVTFEPRPLAVLAGPSFLTGGGSMHGMGPRRGR